MHTGKPSVKRNFGGHHADGFRLRPRSVTHSVRSVSEVRRPLRIDEDGAEETLWTGARVTHRVVDATGLRWHAATTGSPDAPAVVFLHGFPECWFTWHHQMADLGEDFHCVALDLKGHGQSDHRLDSDYDYAAQAAELPAVFDALGLDRFFLVAHDRGAVVADHLCAVPGMAARVRRYVRMQQSGNRPHSEPRPPHELFRSDLGVELLASGALVDMAYGRAELPAGMQPLVAVPVDDRDVDRIRREVMRPGVPEGMSASFVSASFDRELDDRMNGLFHAMTMPVLFLQGALDPGQQPAEYETVADEVETGEVQFVDAGHFLHLEAPAAVSAAIRAYLERDDLAPSTNEPRESDHRR